MRVAIAQVNPSVGDLRENRRLVEQAVDRAASAGADLVALPEMVLTGYPPMDLLERHGFVRDQLRELDALAPLSRELPIVLGAVVPVDDTHPQQLMNAAVLLADGRRAAVRPKSHLPSYDVFDEKRFFRGAKTRETVSIGSHRVGLTVCEDAWVETLGYAVDPTGELAGAGAELVLNLSASPWHVDKGADRRNMLADLARRHQVPLVFVNQVGGNDELIFDGASLACDARGQVLAQLAHFQEDFRVVDIEANPALSATSIEDLPHVEQLEAGLVLGIRDYFRKQGLPPGAVVGLSGGIDSAVTAHLAARALGPERVLGILMPGPFSSEHSVSDAEELGRLLGIEVRQAPIGPIYQSFQVLFAALFGEREDYGLAQQNIQARIRGAILMAVSNAENRLVLATGNKSELSVGYCTLYGDMVGGLAVLGDAYKRDVYALARNANADGPRIPAGSIEKPPSAELAAGQVDSDDLPPYEVLDAILEQAVEGRLSAAEITPPAGVSSKVVRDIVARVDRNEYKRRQAPLVLRTSPKAFGMGRRLPIVHRYQPG
ncbi:MAG: NAD+ synthase [Myxococcota bacterium]|nr:NAD+ synthase [Deltaproteobacteria bacterium]MCP4242835.1 NAD+ synthase [bacterium]MDP6075676.1 NAD+ synthase [Myxococcota bacterium]MDP6244048.1 NAD+ synthase [Myxococcota bacterium]MDP7075420.1 NAD+ synthase [Myxococcota bacterium]